MTTAATPRRPSGRRPKITLGEETLERLEALAEAALARNPSLAERLLEEIDRARVVPQKRLPAKVVAIGNTVTYHDETTGQDHTVTLVFPDDADIDRQRISVMTPIGVALMGLTEGASFHWDTLDDHRRRLTVVRVEPGDTEEKD